jgi:hypothetical protein
MGIATPRAFSLLNLPLISAKAGEKSERETNGNYAGVDNGGLENRGGGGNQGLGNRA